jgi:hypothetical protein
MKPKSAAAAPAPLKCRPVVNLSQRVFVGAYPLTPRNVGLPVMEKPPAGSRGTSATLVQSPQNQSQTPDPGGALDNQDATRIAAPLNSARILRDEHSGLLQDVPAAVSHPLPAFFARFFLGAFEFAEGFATSLTLLHRHRVAMVFQASRLTLDEQTGRRRIIRDWLEAQQLAAGYQHTLQRLAQESVAAAAAKINAASERALPCLTCNQLREDRRKLLVQIARREEEIRALQGSSSSSPWQLGSGGGQGLPTGRSDPSSSSSQGQSSGAAASSQIPAEAKIVQLQRAGGLNHRPQGTRGCEDTDGIMVAVSPMSCSPSVERPPSPLLTAPQPLQLQPRSLLASSMSRSSVSSSMGSISTATTTAASSLVPLQSMLLRQATHEIRVLQGQREALIVLLEKLAPKSEPS